MNELIDHITKNTCILCNVAHKRSPGTIHYEDDDISVFNNLLNWAPIMILFVPKTHMSQDALWQDQNLLPKIAKLAVQIGNKMCPDGYRLLSNFGLNGLQTQEHAHLHLLGGKSLGFYMNL